MANREDLPLREVPTGIVFEVRVAPRASRSAVAGIHAGCLKLSVTAAPVDGDANAAVVELLADLFGVPKRDVRVTRGERSRTKTVDIAGIDATTARNAITRAIA